ncbi:MAG: beta-lactamase family protein [Lachnospiraceae bacterium]|nr:beta-lactamase family protein [Lachnospiraceae bacterium]
MFDITHFEEHIKDLSVLGIKITQNNEDLVHKLWDEECRRNIYSATKSFTSCAVGFSIQEHLLSLEERLVDVFAEEIPENPSDYLTKATIRDLLTMRLGQKEASLMGAQRPQYKEEDWVRLALRIPFVYEPDSTFVYNNVGPYLAGIIVQRRAGCDLISYLTPRLFRPLGIKRPTWETDPSGNTFGAGGLFLTLSELHKFGLFYLQNGMWNQEQLLNREWIAESTRQQGPDPYGYLFWRGEYQSFRADGKYSQLSIVIPDKNAVVSVVAECRKGDELMKYINKDILACL